MNPNSGFRTPPPEIFDRIAVDRDVDEPDGEHFPIVQYFVPDGSMVKLVLSRRAAPSQTRSARKRPLRPRSDW